ncbi:sulfatase [Oceanicola sp. S124]|uniref:sulfatase n=1 Tax=Oceanicola sp. S124 TaxID=1042378 RepID=UPI00049416D0|nr:sulfatase [Oceanicola sp. S124]
MRTIFVLFDSLNRSTLGAFGNTAFPTPNFDRLAARAVTFDTHYAGSLPCMPARRDMHTGRLNFTHRPWGPLEPFDNSYAQLLSTAGVYTHLVSDHQHYFETGGWGYAQAFDSWDFIRGQENDPVAVFAVPPVERIRQRFDPRHYPTDGMEPGRTATRRTLSKNVWKRSRHAINRLEVREEDDFPTAKCFRQAFDFLDRNRDSDDWFLQIECFDPHEPFDAPERFKALFDTGYDGPILDWPLYEKCTNSSEEIAEIRGNYAALVSMCDAYFGKLLDWMDENDAWSDTALILTTDHGYLLGEHEWWAKNRMPYYEEISHIPLMIWHPDVPRRAEGRVTALTQTVDLMPTFLDLHGVTAPEEVRAHSMLPLLRGENPQRETAILGMFGGPICATDGRYTYFRFPETGDPSALPLYTLMPSQMEELFSVRDLSTAELVEGFDFSQGAPLLRIRLSEKLGEAGMGILDNWHEGHVLYDLSSDPGQTRPIEDAAVEARLLDAICAHLRAHDAPRDLYDHYALTDRTTTP